MPREATAPARSGREPSSAKLAKFFTDASPVRIPIRLTKLDGEKESFAERTVIEFGTTKEVLFVSTLPLEFADILRLQNSDGTLDAEVSVVALEYSDGCTAVAARFTQKILNWIVKS